MGRSAYWRYICSTRAAVKRLILGLVYIRGQRYIWWMRLCVAALCDMQIIIIYGWMNFALDRCKNKSVQCLYVRGEIQQSLINIINGKLAWIYCWLLCYCDSVTIVILCFMWSLWYVLGMIALNCLPACLLLFYYSK